MSQAKIESNSKEVKLLNEKDVSKRVESLKAESPKSEAFANLIKGLIVFCLAHNVRYSWKTKGMFVGYKHVLNAMKVLNGLLAGLPSLPMSLMEGPVVQEAKGLLSSIDMGTDINHGRLRSGLGSERAAFSKALSVIYGKLSDLYDNDVTKHYTNLWKAFNPHDSSTVIDIFKKNRHLNFFSYDASNSQDGKSLADGDQLKSSFAEINKHLTGLSELPMEFQGKAIIHVYDEFLKALIESSKDKTVGFVRYEVVLCQDLENTLKKLIDAASHQYYEDLAARNTELAKQYLNLADSYKTLFDDYKIRKAEVEEKTAKLDEQEAALKQKTEEIKNKRAENLAKQKLLDAKALKLNKQALSLQKVNEEILARQESLEELEAEVTEKEENLEKREKDIEDRLKRAMGLEEKATQREQQAIELEKKAKQSEQQAIQLEKKAESKLKEIKERYQENLKKLTGKYKDAKCKLELKATQLKDKDLKLKARNIENETLKFELEQSRLTCATLNETLTNLRNKSLATIADLSGVSRSGVSTSTKLNQPTKVVSAKSNKVADRYFLPNTSEKLDQDGHTVTAATCRFLVTCMERVRKDYSSSFTKAKSEMKSELVLLQALFLVSADKLEGNLNQFVTTSKFLKESSPYAEQVNSFIDIIKEAIKNRTDKSPLLSFDKGDKHCDFFLLLDNLLYKKRAYRQSDQKISVEPNKLCFSLFNHFLKPIYRGTVNIKSILISDNKKLENSPVNSSVAFLNSTSGKENRVHNAKIKSNSEQSQRSESDALSQIK